MSFRAMSRREREERGVTDHTERDGREKERDIGERGGGLSGAGIRTSVSFSSARSLFLSLFLSFPLSQSHALSHTHSRTRAHSRARSLARSSLIFNSLSHTLSLSLSCSASLSLLPDQPNLLQVEPPDKSILFRIQVYLATHDSGYVSLEQLLLSCTF